MTVILKEHGKTEILTDEDLDMFWYEGWDDPKLKQADREENELTDEWEDLIPLELDWEIDKISGKKKIRLTGKYKEKRFIP